VSQRLHEPDGRFAHKLLAERLRRERVFSNWSKMHQSEGQCSTISPTMTICLWKVLRHVRLAFLSPTTCSTSFTYHRSFERAHLSDMCGLCASFTSGDKSSPKTCIANFTSQSCLGRNQRTLHLALQARMTHHQISIEFLQRRILLRTCPRVLSGS
jgi:hypothetical protein